MLNWVCPKCGKESEVNTDNPRLKDGRWKVGSKEKLFCWSCHKNLFHIIKETNEVT